VINRRTFLCGLTLGTLTVPLAVEAQPTQRVYRIGFLGQTSPSDYSSQIAALRQGLRDAGYQEGANLFIEYRWAEGRLGRLPSLATDLVRLKVDLIVTHGTAGSRAAKQATATIPIVFATAGDPVRDGIVTSLSRPGGNITGLSIQQTDLLTKQLDLLKQVAPTVSRVVQLRVAGSGPDVDESFEQEQNAAARSLGLELKKVVVEPKDPTHAFLHVAQHGAHAIVVENTPALWAHAAAIAALAVDHRLPTIGAPWFTKAGLLLGYGPRVEDMYRVAYFVAKIQKGTRPGDLPVEQSTTFELVINMKTAKAIGLTIPLSVLGRADQVIE
jgi:putative ABC transport system substrate-binding protein